eukprot:s2034_g12.t2
MKMYEEIRLLSLGEEKGSRLSSGCPVSEVAEKLDVVVKSSDARASVAFSSCLSAEERKYVHHLAEQFGLRHESKGRGDARFISVTKDPGKATGRVRWLGEAARRNLGLSLSSRDRCARNRTAEEIPKLAWPEAALEALEHPLVEHAAEGNNAQVAASSAPLQAVSPRTIDRLLQSKQALPAWHCREQLLEAVRSKQVTLVIGETGCGKSTQVSFFLYGTLAGAGPKNQTGFNRPAINETNRTALKIALSSLRPEAVEFVENAEDVTEENIAQYVLHQECFRDIQFTDPVDGAAFFEDRLRFLRGLNQLAHVISSLEMMMRFEKARGRRFKEVILTRPDLRYGVTRDSHRWNRDIIPWARVPKWISKGNVALQMDFWVDMPRALAERVFCNGLKGLPWGKHRGDTAATDFSSVLGSSRGSGDLTRDVFYVGYSVHLEHQSSLRTRLHFCTAGVVRRRVLETPDLPEVTHVVMDELHERDKVELPCP